MHRRVVLGVNELANGKLGIEFDVEEHSGTDVKWWTVTPSGELTNRLEEVRAGVAAVETYMRDRFGQEPDEYTFEMRP